MNKVKVVQLARIPCANTGFYVSQLINDFSREFSSRYILGSTYSKKFQDQVPFREFPTDLFWETQKTECIKVIQEAEIIHIHHGFWETDPNVIGLFKGKKIIFSVYDLSLENNIGYFERIRKLGAVITVADQPAQKRVFGKYSNIYLPLVNCFWGDVVKNNEMPHLVYSPTNRYPITNHSSKGYYEVTAIIKKLQENGLKFTFDLIEGVSHREDLERKKKADIIIDDVINNTMHNTSLHAVMFNAVPVTGYSGVDFPFVKADLATLEQVLSSLISNREKFEEKRRELQRWYKINYNPFRQCGIYENLYLKLLENKIETFQISETPRKTGIMVFIDLLEILVKHSPVCFLGDTCLRSVKGSMHQEMSEFTLGIKEIPEKELVENGFTVEPNKILKDSITVNLEIYPQGTKAWKFNKFSVTVPCPVVGYLRKKFGTDWGKK